MEVLGIALVILGLVLNIGATMWALLSVTPSRERRLLMVLLVWAVPVIGALLTFYVITRRTASSGSPQLPQQPDDTMAVEVLAQGSAETAIRMVANNSLQRP